MEQANVLVKNALDNFTGKQVRSHSNVPLGTVTWVGDDVFEVTKGWLHMPFLTRKRLIATDQVEQIASHYIKLRPLSNLYWQMPGDQDEEVSRDKAESHYFVL